MDLRQVVQQLLHAAELDEAAQATKRAQPQHTKLSVTRPQTRRGRPQSVKCCTSERMQQTAKETLEKMNTLDRTAPCDTISTTHDTSRHGRDKHTQMSTVCSWTPASAAGAGTGKCGPVPTQRMSASSATRAAVGGSQSTASGRMNETYPPQRPRLLEGHQPDLQANGSAKLEPVELLGSWTEANGRTR